MIVMLGGNEVVLTPEGAAWIPALGLLCVADLHFEKSTFFSRFGALLPPYDSRETITRLQQAVERYRPTIVVAAGDSFHDKKAGERMAEAEADTLNALVAGVVEWRWLSGNHDPAPSERIAGLCGDELPLGGIMFRHKTMREPVAEISGHFHPKARVRLGGHGLSAACFVLHQERLILPSFGQFTGGLDVDSAAFRHVVPVTGRRLYIPYDDRVFAV